MSQDSPDRSHRFGNLQLRLMRLLWARPHNARELTDALNQDAAEKPVAHSTVQTLLRKLEDKGAVTHDVQDRTFIFRPLVQEENALLRASREMLQKLFGGSVTGLVSHLLKHEKISTDELVEIRKMIQQKEKGDKP